MNKSEVTLTIFAYFSKAFDTVDYRPLLQHLSNLGFSQQSLLLIENYLTNRKQFVQVDDRNSETLDVQFGVPQGSILGPILFNLYVTTINMNGPLAYADDTTLLQHSKIKDLPITIESMQAEMNNINQSLERNNLSLNAKKNGQFS